MLSLGSRWHLTHFLTFFIVVNCNTSCLKYEHCEFHPGHHLDCFSRWEGNGMKQWRCEWEPGTSAHKNTYTLIKQQGQYCETKHNISGQNEEMKIFQRQNMTVLLVENLKSQNCTKAVFKGTPTDLFRCGPPTRSSFRRHSGILDVNVVWMKQESKYIKDFNVRYTTMGEGWKVYAKLGKNGQVDGLNSSQSYMVQIKCERNSRCSQCPWSHNYIIPPELKTKPTLIHIEKTDHPTAKGIRLVTITWQSVEIDKLDGYFMNVQKASGEQPNNQFNTREGAISLHLSCSAFTVNISAFNNVSVSPVLTQNIENCDAVTSMDTERLHVTVHSETSFTVQWDAQLLDSYNCYSVEWSRRNQHKAEYLSFFEKEASSKTVDLTGLESLEPYKRYMLYLHTRPNKETCDLKHVNSSESTYASVQFYYMEGTPISAPTNISYHSVTSSSLVLQWSPIPEDDLRGFLLGYIIYYKEYSSRDTSAAEKVAHVGAETTSYVIEDLKPGTGYNVEILGFTRAGTGVRSIKGIFKTCARVYMKNTVIIMIFVATIVLLVVACTIVKRMKAVLWPSLPHPDNSNAIQKIENSREIEQLQMLQTLKVEEWHTNELLIIKEQTTVSVPHLATAESKVSTPPSVRDSDTPLKSLLGPQTAFTCGYTTMEMFQKLVTFQSSPSMTQKARERSIQDDVVENKPGHGDVGQFSSGTFFDLSTTF